jgi:hypothetical protein
MSAKRTSQKLDFPTYQELAKLVAQEINTFPENIKEELLDFFHLLDEKMEDLLLMESGGLLPTTRVEIIQC